MESITTLRKTARRTGLLYFIWVLSGLFGVMYIPSKTIVSGDAAATAQRVLAHEFLFRIGTVNDIISNIIWIFVALLLYRLFKQVNERQAKLLVVFVVVQIPALFFMEASNIASLMILKGEVLNTFGDGQRQDLAMLFLNMGDYGSLLLEVFWGLWLFPFGFLVYQSGFIPRILGILLVLNGISYVMHSFTRLLFPDYQALVYKISVPFWILGEISIMLWFIIRGVKNKPGLNMHTPG